MLGRQPTETARLVRLVLGTYGRLEGLLVGRSDEALDRPFRDGTSAVAMLTSAVDDAAATAASLRPS